MDCVGEVGPCYNFNYVRCVIFYSIGCSGDGVEDMIEMTFTDSVVAIVLVVSFGFGWIAARWLFFDRKNGG